MSGQSVSWAREEILPKTLNMVANLVPEMGPANCAVLEELLRGSELRRPWWHSSGCVLRTQGGRKESREAPTLCVGPQAEPRTGLTKGGGGTRG